MLVKNLTPFVHATKLTSRRPPEPEMTLIVRATLRAVHEGVAEPIEGLDQGFLSVETYAKGDEERGGEALSPNDLADMKLCGEVMLKGTCHPPSKRRVTECPVRFSVGKWRKELMVYGDRKWESAIGGTRISEPVPFDTMPIDYRHAFGGPGYAANPVGKGFRSDALPNVELTSQMVTARNQERPPGCFGPVSPAWASRAGKIGKNYGASWSKHRAPYYSDDFDWSYFHAAPADQQMEGYLRGDEEVRFHNLHPEHSVLATRLPGRRVRAFLKDDRGSFREVGLVLDTLFAEPDEGTIKLTWRGVAPVREDDFADVQTMLIADEPLGEKPLSLDHYRAAMEAFEKDPTGVLAGLPVGLSELWERHQKQRRGEVLPEVPGDSSLDPVTREMKRQLGPLLSDEETARIGDAMKDALQKLENVPEDKRPNIEELVAKSRVEAANTPPPMRLLKPGARPPTGLRKDMREILSQAAELRRQEKQIGREIQGIDKLEALPFDPKWKEADPTYEPPGPLSTDEPRPGADLRERDLSRRDLRGLDLRGADLSLADLSRADLRGADLRKAKLSHAVLYLADLRGADLREADLSLVNAAYVRAEKANFAGANLEEAFLEEADLRAADLSKARAAYAIFEKADLRGARAERAIFDHASLSEARLEGAVMRGVSLKLAKLEGVSAKGVDLEDADLGQASFREADLTSARLSGVKAKKSFFLKAKLTLARMGYADLREAHLTEADARGALLGAANLAGARLYRTDLAKASLVHANLMSADLRKANLDGADLTGASMFEASILGARGEFDLRAAIAKRALRGPQ